MNNFILPILLFLSGCASKNNQNKKPTESFDKLDQNRDEIITIDEYSRAIIDNYDYTGPLFWLGVILGVVFFINLVVSYISRK
jgi:hypothetical protein